MKQNRSNEINWYLTYYDLRALLFWASVGIAKSESGSYRDAAMRDGDMGIVKSIAEHIYFSLPCKPAFGSERRNKP